MSLDQHSRLAGRPGEWPGDEPPSASGSTPAGPGPTSPADLDRALRRLRDSARVFARLAPREKASLLRASRELFHAGAAEMVELGCRAKGIEPRSSLAGEDWFSGPAISIRALRLFERALEDVADAGAPRLDAGDIQPFGEGRTRVRLVPHDGYDRALFPRLSCDAWLAARRSAAEVRERQARFYRQRDPEGRVVLVLGAGNVGSISILDVLYHSFVEGAVCLLKMSPVNAYLGPCFERALAPLVGRGFLALAYGGPEVGAYLTSHADVDAIHVTGSVETHDRIVWGEPGPERAARKEAGTPLIHKPVTSELGNVSPVLVVPGDYSDRELDAAARSIAGMVVHNASFNCNAAKLIVTARGFAQRGELLSRVRRVFAETPTRFAYYPGARARFDALVGVAGSADVARHGDDSAGRLPWTLISNLDPGSDSPLFETEPFCSIVSETALVATDAAEFLPLATRFCNEKVWGTLNTMLVTPRSAEQDAGVRAAVERAITELRYGTVGVNVWPAVGYGLCTPPWGGYPGATLDDVESGIGWGHNAFLLDEVEKVVLRGPLVDVPEPFWYPGHRRLRELGEKLARLEAGPSVGGVLGAAWAAFRR